MASRLFDLNIEEVLDNWEVEHAIREVISNAFDEQTLSGSAEPRIFQDDDGRWHVKDEGRGLRIEHFTLNENKEKVAASSGIIGKFGVGLKDALATFHRRGIGVEILSAHGSFRLKETQKHNFSGINTLHVVYDDDPVDVRGTDFVLTGASDEQMDEAKSLFLRFSGDEELESTKYGEILTKREDSARVYISGVFASEEPNFMFSYNISDLTPAMKKRLNRERLNVGRTTYADRVRSILRAAESSDVLDALADRLTKRASGDVPDELQWLEIAQLTLTHVHQTTPSVFVTEIELHSHPDLVDHARRDGLKIVIVTRAEKAKLLEQAEAGGIETRTLETYVAEFNDSFEYTLVSPEKLEERERRIFELVPDLFGLIGVGETDMPEVLVSETMRLTRDDTYGVWDPEMEAIVIKRSQLGDPVSFAATLLHEAAHATTGTVDATREFEGVLTEYLGLTSAAALATDGTAQVSAR